MKKYILALLIGFCWGIIGISFTAFAEADGAVTCCTQSMIDRREPPCGSSDCKDVDLSGDYGGTSPEVAEKKRCCSQSGGANIMDPGSTGTYVCCSPGSSKKLTGSYDKACCRAAGGKDMDNIKCCSQWSTAKKDEAALPMCKK